MPNLLSSHQLNEFIEDLQFGFLDQALATLGSDQISVELIADGRVREAAVRGIRQQLLDSRGDGDFEIAARIKRLFHIPSEEIAEIVQQGIENWTTDKGKSYGEQVCRAFDVPLTQMETASMKELVSRQMGRPR